MPRKRSVFIKSTTLLLTLLVSGGLWADVKKPLQMYSESMKKSNILLIIFGIHAQLGIIPKLIT